MLRVAVKLLHIDTRFVGVTGVDAGADAEALISRVLEARATKLTGKESGDLTLFYAGAEQPDPHDEDAILLGKPTNPLKLLRAIVGDAATAEAFFIVKVAGAQPSTSGAGA